MAARGQAIDETIVVIGAGISGLAAAKQLHNQGFRVTVLEARDRIGGRIWTNRSLGFPVDLGASWIHGVQGNPITQLAKQFQLKTMATDDEAVELFDQDGRSLEEEEYQQIEAVYADVLEALEEWRQSEDESVSLQDALTEILGEAHLSGTVERGVHWLIASSTVIEAGADLKHLSLLYWDEDEGFPGDDVVFTQGYDQIPQQLAKGLSIELQQTVQAIAYGGDGVTVTTDQGRFQADRVVITLPLGVLQRGSVRFTPTLPPEKQAAIQRLAMGTLGKVALHFPKRFWPAEDHYLGSLQPSAQTVMAFWSLYPAMQVPALVAFVGGSEAERMESISEAEAVAQVMGQLRSMLGNAIPAPMGVLRTRWHQDPLAGGSYSHVPPAASLEDYQILAEPVEDRLFFAGEATHASYPATVHGAFLSGQREAKQILKLAR
jgi:monoamine oxidase